jgi:hypothetical protein
MYQALQVVSLLLVSAAMAFALAHAAELPGKLRLGREAYAAVQTIYYPGFTIGGIAEPAAIVALGALVLTTATADPIWPWLVGALMAMLAMQATYWLMTHPVNRVWLKDQKMGDAGTTFFESMAAKDRLRTDEWTALRSRWEWSHVIRSGFAVAGLSLLAIAVTSD